MVFSSNLDLQLEKGSDLILQTCLFNKADIYLCGESGKNYLKEEDFKNHKVKIEWLNYVSPIYSQTSNNFTPNLSALDLLFNHGEKSLELLMNGKK